MNASLPSGVVTFLMSDVESSGPRWAADAAAMKEAVRALDRAAGDSVAKHGGALLKARGEGDSHFAVFTRPSDAVMAAAALHEMLDAMADETLGLLVRIGVHVGEADPARDDYYGIAVNQTARVRSVAHGGQTVLSRNAAAIATPALDGNVRLTSLGHHRLRDFPRLEELFQAAAVGARASFPPLRTGETRSPAVLAVVFVDVCDSSAVIRAAADTVDTMELQRTWGTNLRHLGAMHSAATLKLLGDGCLAAFEDPLEAIAFTRAAAASLAGTGVPIRAGMHAGRVEIFDGEVIGETVFTAAHVIAAAAPGQLLMTSSLRALAGAVAARSLGHHTLRSSPEAVELFALDSG